MPISVKHGAKTASLPLPPTLGALRSEVRELLDLPVGSLEEVDSPPPKHRVRLAPHAPAWQRLLATRRASSRTPSAILAPSMVPLRVVVCDAATRSHRLPRGGRARPCGCRRAAADPRQHDDGEARSHARPLGQCA